MFRVAVITVNNIFRDECEMILVHAVDVLIEILVASYMQLITVSHFSYLFIYLLRIIY